jgi:hypothetical protein
MVNKNYLYLNALVLSVLDVLKLLFPYNLMRANAIGSDSTLTWYIHICGYRGRNKKYNKIKND